MCKGLCEGCVYSCLLELTMQATSSILKISSLFMFDVVKSEIVCLLWADSAMVSDTVGTLCLVAVLAIVLPCGLNKKEASICNQCMD